MTLFKTQSRTSKLIVIICIYGYYIIWYQVLALAFNPSWIKEITDPGFLSPTNLNT